MNKINYHNETLRILDAINGDKKPDLLLHACCAPCSSYCIEWLCQYFNIHIDFYNPNLDTNAEYDRRLEEVIKLREELQKSTKNTIDIVFDRYAKADFAGIYNIRRHTNEGGMACRACYALRLRHAAVLAVRQSCDYFTTTLSISPMKNANILNTIGQRLSKEYGVKYLLSDFKKNDGYKRSIELSKKYGLYRQDYCGCSFSKIERDKRNNGNS